MAEEHFQFLEQTRRVFRQIENVLQQHELLSDTLWQGVEEKLLFAGIGSPTSRWIIQHLQQQVKEGQISSGSQAYMALRQELTRFLKQPSMLHYSEQSPVALVIVMGDNDADKTTIIAKLAYRLSHEGRNVLLVATNTFRSSSISRLKAWAERINVPVIYQNDDPDFSSVIHDALQSALVRKFDVVLIGTAGRLVAEKKHLEELKNITNAAQKVVPGTPHELLIVIDVAQGQTILPYVHAVAESTGLTGVILSNVENTTKGGFAFEIADDLGVPIKFLGTGEKIEQLVSFDAERFVAALFEKE
jgi:fused signal recognition particle receptor